jgi:HEPN domain-containing protein
VGKNEQIDYWLDSSASDIEAAGHLLAGGSNLQALFFIHLALEKILKAHFIKTNVSQPPLVHDLIFLHDQTDVNLDDEDLRFLAQANGWNIEGRYPDYKKSLHRIASREFVTHAMHSAKKVWKKLREKLP